MNLELILSNPYRMLGVYVNARPSEIVKNLSRSTAFLQVGKSVSFPTDCLMGLPAPERSMESMALAQSALDLPTDRLGHAFLWMGQGASEWVFILNSSVMALVNGDIASAAAGYARLLHEEALRTSFEKAVCGDASSISEADMTSLLWMRLMEVVPYQDLLPFLGGVDYAFVQGQAASVNVRSVMDRISGSLAEATDDPESQRAAGVRLMEGTRIPLRLIREAVGTEHPDYKSTADALARQILQFAVNYFNGTEGGDGDVDQALSLVEYAHSIACSSTLQERCAMNLETLKDKKQQAPYRQSLDTVMNLIQPFKGENGSKAGSSSLPDAQDLQSASLAPLALIKEKAGAGDEDYLNASSAVANLCLNILVDDINRKQDVIPKREFRSLLKSADGLMDRLGRMDLTLETRNRVSENKVALQSLLKESRPDYSWVFWVGLGVVFAIFLMCI